MLWVAWWCASPFLRVARRAWDLWVSLVFAVVAGWRRRASLPPVFNPLLLLSAQDLATQIRERKVKSVEVVRAYIMRTSDVNAVVNGLAQERFQEALIEARNVDDRLDEGYADGSLSKEFVKEDQPFLGVPFTVKDTIAATGLPHTGGLWVRAKVRSPTDADVVRRMKRAGAILLGNTNVSEVGQWWECDNRVYGRTSNPYDPRRTSGGSSGGEGALMSACGTPLSIGSDTGGSIRIPAFFCGLFGHKPTAGLVSVRGCNIHHQQEWSDMQCCGPLTRHAADLRPVLAALVPDPQHRLALYKNVDIGRLQIFTMEGDGEAILTSAVDPALVAVQRAVASHLSHTYDLSVRKVNIPGLKNSFKIFNEKLSEEYEGGTSITQQLADNKGEINVWTEVTRAVLRRPHHTAPLLVQALHEKLVGEVAFLRTQRKVLQGKDPHAVTLNHAETLWKKLQMKIQRLLGDGGVLLYPSHPTLAPYHTEPLFRPLNFTYTAAFNALGFPVTQVPLGLAHNGLPLGIQVVGGLHMDHLTIAVAEDLEKAFGGWVCPSKIL